MNYARVIGKVIEKRNHPKGSFFIIRTRRRGTREVFDDVYIITKEKDQLNVGEAYEIVGKLGMEQITAAKDHTDICVFAERVVSVAADTVFMNEIIIKGTVTSKETNPKIPNKMSLLLKADDGSCEGYKVVAWNKRVVYVSRKNIGDVLEAHGELVRYTYWNMHELHHRIEIVFLYEDRKS